MNNTEFSVFRKYSAVTPGGMSKEVGGGGGGGGGAGAAASLSKFPAVGKAGKKATTLFLQSTLLARLSRKLGRDKVRNWKIFPKIPILSLFLSNIEFIVSVYPAGCSEALEAC